MAYWRGGTFYVYPRESLGLEALTLHLAQGPNWVVARSADNSLNLHRDAVNFWQLLGIQHSVLGRGRGTARCFWREP